ncbi:MAG: tRNA epoxyqueuosine(34) reductase QueG [Alphaproteobacteria bacterium]|nr:tRNA epoxyqueuosine(34) reductase QueG [Alphaproteobacteria bacterium]MDX5415413.1 tRNA epoxyqueuosine(34) reductase QueG [Alphaproteobacteria bacterium]MDX5492630.1 tRNA epoxyqueuosine(34) reductase QueG [Alphaproteobacteria bacterium]
MGFDAVGITTPQAFRRMTYDPPAQLDRFLELGRHGDMDWIEAHHARRRDPQGMWPDARSVVMLATSYAPSTDPLEVLAHPHRAALSVYARGKDYHDIVKGRLKQLAQRIAREAAAEVKVFVDTAPLMEKPLAAAAGLGWQGKHTNLVSTTHGSWLFLGAILTSVELSADTPHADRCGTCTRCLDVCPTQAFPAPYQLDARRCIAYLTIEHQGHIPRAFRGAIGNRVFGCDECLAVCPWNKFASKAREDAFHSREELEAPLLAELALLDDAAFRAFFAGSPIKRIGRDRFLRNVLIAIGNSGVADLRIAVRALVEDASPLVRAAAIWALGELGIDDDLRAHAQHALEAEPDEAVCEEWRYLLR